jgi:hypothetical protein
MGGLPTLAVDGSRYQPREITMNPIRHIGRLTAALAGLVCAWLGLAVAAPAAFAALSVPPPGSRPPGSNKHPPLPPGRVTGPVYKVPVRSVVVGGMPGWQIALIAIGAALLAATAAVLACRAWTIRRKPVVPAAPEPSVPGADVLSVP